MQGLESESQILIGLILLLIGGAGGAALRSWVSTVRNTTEIKNLKERIERIEDEQC